MNKINIDNDCCHSDNEWKTVTNKKNKKIKRCNLDNYKKTLCRNKFNGNCPFDKTCKFAHSHNEQILLGVRKIAYDMIKLDDSLGYINLYEDNVLYRELLRLTNICDGCLNKECFGGYNCRNGVFDIKYQICKNDLVKGYCNDTNCKKVHLTKKGLMCYEKSCMKYINIPDIIVLNDNFFEKENNKYKIKKIEKDILSDNCSIDTFINFNIDNDNENILDKSIFKIELSLLLS
jgi:hypothetical protein